MSSITVVDNETVETDEGEYLLASVNESTDTNEADESPNEADEEPFAESLDVQGDHRGHWPTTKEAKEDSEPGVSLLLRCVEASNVINDPKSNKGPKCNSFSFLYA